ncbi:MAG: sulfotransferase [Actinomycetota bacterium]
MNPAHRPPAAAIDEVVDVVCIGGTGQNGATLLSRMLGAVPGIVAIGEIGRLWDTGLIENRPCSCGVPFRECPFWTAVGDSAFDGWDRVDGYAVARAREGVRLKRRLRGLPPEPVPRLRDISSKVQMLPFLLLGRFWPEYRVNQRAFTDNLGRLYRGIRDTSGARVVLDSMKVPYHVYMLRNVPGIRLRVVHLVRDVRGVAYSNTRTVAKQGAEGRYRVTRHPAKTGMRWTWVNLSLHLLKRLGVPVLRVRYEDVVRSPKEQIAAIARFAGLDVGAEDLSFIAGDELDLPADHIVAGNRVRMTSGPLRLRVDDGWRTGLSRRQRFMATLAGRPLLRRYGYLGGGERAGTTGAGPATGPGSPSAIISP